MPVIHAAWSNSALSNILPSKHLNTSEENLAPKQVQALQHIIIPVMWMSEAEVRAAPFSFCLGQCRGGGVFLLTSPEGGWLSLSRGVYWRCETASVCYTPLCYTPHSGTNSCLFRLSKVAHLTASVKLVLRPLQDQSRKCLSTALLWYCKTPDSGHHVHLYTPNRSAFIPTPTLPSGVNIEFGPCVFNMCTLVMPYFQGLLLHIYILHIYSIYLFIYGYMDGGAAH